MVDASLNEFLFAFMENFNDIKIRTVRAIYIYIYIYINIGNIHGVIIITISFHKFISLKYAACLHNCVIRSIFGTVIRAGR